MGKYTHREKVTNNFSIPQKKKLYSINLNWKVVAKSTTTTKNEPTKYKKQEKLNEHLEKIKTEIFFFI